MRKEVEKVVQFFNGSKFKYARRNLSEVDMQRILKYTNKNMVQAFAHCPYVINLAKDPLKESKHLSALYDDIKTMGPSGISSVCHVGHHLDKFTLSSVCRTLSCLKFSGEEDSYPLLLENAASDGTELGVTWDELTFLAQNTNSHVGFCIDTQHLFASDQFDKEINFNTVNGVNEFFKKLDRTIGLKRLKLFHLNDSRYNPKDPISSKKYCTRKDSHANISCGYIWGNKEDLPGLRHLLLRGGELNIPFITETKTKKGKMPDPEIVYNFLRDGV